MSATAAMDVTTAFTARSGAPPSATASGIVKITASTRERSPSVSAHSSVATSTRCISAHQANASRADHGYTSSGTCRKPSGPYVNSTSGP